MIRFLLTHLLWLLLAVAVFYSALMLIQLRHENRQLFVQWQQLQRDERHYQEQSGQLQLEYSVLTRPQRIQRLAKERLQMVMPDKHREQLTIQR